VTEVAVPAPHDRWTVDQRVGAGSARRACHNGTLAREALERYSRTLGRSPHGSGEGFSWGPGVERLARPSLPQPGATPRQVDPPI